MNTITENLKEMNEEIKAELKNLLLSFSKIYRYNNLGRSGISTLGRDYTWKPLEPQGHRLQSKILGDYQKYYAVLYALLSQQPQKVLKALDKSDHTINLLIEQNTKLWIKSAAEAFGIATKALDTQLLLIENIYGAASKEVVYVPDTNALLFNPNIEFWQFPDVIQFTIVLTPTVLSELDHLKITHRVENVRSTAEGLIRRIKGYRTRGRLTDGVILIRNISRLKSVATEPDMANSLPWLDSNNNDRILAAFIEVMRLHPQSSVILVTRDINLQNKAEFARLPFVEPPD